MERGLPKHFNVSIWASGKFHAANRFPNAIIVASRLWTRPRAILLRCFTGLAERGRKRTEIGSEKRNTSRRGPGGTITSEISELNFVSDVQLILFSYKWDSEREFKTIQSFGKKKPVKSNAFNPRKKIESKIKKKTVVLWWFIFSDHDYQLN